MMASLEDLQATSDQLGIVAQRVRDIETRLVALQGIEIAVQGVDGAIQKTREDTNQSVQQLGGRSQ